MKILYRFTLALSLLSTAASASETILYTYRGTPSFDILGYTTPAQAAVDFPFTFSVYLRAVNGSTLTEVRKALQLEGNFIGSAAELNPRGSSWVFPYKPYEEERGLIQYLFIPGPSHAGGKYTLSAALRITDESSKVTSVPLPERKLEVGHQILHFDCANESKSKLEFFVDQTEGQVLFQRKNALGNVQLPLQHILAALVEEKARALAFDYNWYYTAQYKMKFANSYLETGKTTMTLTYDDFDGSSGEELPFTCGISKANLMSLK